jgi:hypothetical protein
VRERGGTIEEKQEKREEMRREERRGTREERRETRKDNRIAIDDSAVKYTSAGDCVQVRARTRERSEEERRRG